MKRALIILASALLFTNCNNNNSNDLPVYIDRDNINANVSGNKYATRTEIPYITDDDLFITHSTTTNGKESVNFSIAHSPERKHSRWVAFTFDPSNRAKNWNRNNWDNTSWGGDPFQPDPVMPYSYVFTKDEINRNGYVRGHLVASADRLQSKDANEQTFYYSNISPMLSRFNEGKWLELEGKVQGWGRNSGFCDTLFVVKGGTIREGEYKSVTNDNGLTCKTVPLYYYMALLCRYKDTYKAAGFYFEHKNYLNGNLSDYAMTIDELEDKTGIDFFCNLPDKLEKAVEQYFSPTQWTGLK
jgi:endonuclease G